MPARNRIVRATVAAALGLPLAVYWWTAAPTVTLVDSGELILAAALPGVAHPPGFSPLHPGGASVGVWLPLGSVARRLNLMSAFFAGVCALLMMFLAREVWVGAPVAEAGEQERPPRKNNRPESAGRLKKREAGRAGGRGERKTQLGR